MKEESALLRKIALRTWSYFDDHVSKQTNYLPPDNIQGIGPRKIAHYTSISNIGYYMSSLFSAYDLHFISLNSLVSRSERTVGTLTQMERFRGHFYNWYVMGSLRPSKPFYVSTVDSGNFIACAVTLSEGLRMSFDKYTFHNKMFDGIEGILLECLEYRAELEPKCVQLIEEFMDVLQRPVSTVLGVYKLVKVADSYVVNLSKYKLPLGHPFNGLLRRLKKKKDSLKSEIWGMFPVVDSEDFNTEINGIVEALHNAPTLKELIIYLEQLAAALDKVKGESARKAEDQVREKLSKIEELARRRDVLIETLERFAAEADFSFLYDEKKKLVSIGYKVMQKRKEKYHYGTLLSESRLAVFLSIAKNNIPKKAWGTLTRKVKKGKKGLFVLSWGGTMFEYFMPAIFMKCYPESIYKQTYDAFLYEEISAAKRLDIPWGFSESLYADLTFQGRYKYKAFGLAAAAMNPHVDDRKVVSPYSTFIAMRHDYQSSIQNLQLLVRDGALGEYGVYESIDYSPSKTKEPVVVYAYMSHHQGMILNSINNVLNDNIIVKLFHSNKIVKTVEYLLEENRSGPAPSAELTFTNVKNIQYIYN